MSWLIAAYAAVLIGVAVYMGRIRRLRRELNSSSDPRPPHP